MTVSGTPSSRFTVLLPSSTEPWPATVRTLLEPQGISLLSARTGREALQLIESTTIHVAVLDQRMPQLGGLQVIRLMRDMHPHRPTAAILVADQMSNGLLQEALGMHVFSVLSKPVDYAQLLDTLARILKRHQDSKWVS